jgi:hypothetical protein
MRKVVRYPLKQSALSNQKLRIGTPHIGLPNPFRGAHG